MALIKCKECGKEISGTAESCPHCGYKTQHGKTAAMNQTLRIKRWIYVGALLLGLVLVVTNIGTLFSRYDEWELADGIVRDIWGITEVTFLEYLGVHNERSVFWATIIGAIMIPCGTVGTLVNLPRMERRESEYSDETNKIIKRVHIGMIFLGLILFIANGIKLCGLYDESRDILAFIRYDLEPDFTFMEYLSARNETAVLWVMIIGAIITLWGIVVVIANKDRWKYNGMELTNEIRLYGGNTAAENENARVEWVCAACGERNIAEVCQRCGATKSWSEKQWEKGTETQDEWECPSCGHINEKYSANGKKVIFCTNCGAKLEE